MTAQEEHRRDTMYISASRNAYVHRDKDPQNKANHCKALFKLYALLYWIEFNSSVHPKFREVYVIKFTFILSCLIICSTFWLDAI